MKPRRTEVKTYLKLDLKKYIKNKESSEVGMKARSPTPTFDQENPSLNQIMERMEEMTAQMDVLKEENTMLVKS